MSIYVAVPSFYDNQLPYTITEALSMARNPKEVFINVVFMDVMGKWETPDHDKFFNEQVLPLADNSQVSIKRYRVGEYIPTIGFGRNSALAEYSNQDYILQIDSHTKFEKDWDVILVDMYKDALKETGNEKTILTAYLPSYEHDDSNTRGYFGESKLAKYPFFVCEFRFQGGFPSWRDFNLVTGQFKCDALYVPCVKANAQFMFSNKHFYENHGLPETVVFWEEELIQTMNLLESGFSLVFPNKVVPLAHLFHNNVNNNFSSYSFRVSGANPKGLSVEGYIQEIRDSYLAFIKDPRNKSAVDRFFKYTKTHPVYGPYLEGYIPPSYNR